MVQSTRCTTFRALGAWPEKVVPKHISDAPQPGRHRPQYTSAAADHPRPINSTLEGEQGYMCQFSLAAHKTPLSAEATVRDPRGLINSKAGFWWRDLGNNLTLLADLSTIPSTIIFKELEHWTILDLEGLGVLKLSTGPEKVVRKTDIASWLDPTSSFLYCSRAQLALSELLVS